MGVMLEFSFSPETFVYLGIATAVTGGIVAVMTSALYFFFSQIAHLDVKARRLKALSLVTSVLFINLAGFGIAALIGWKSALDDFLYVSRIPLMAALAYALYLLAYEFGYRLPKIKDILARVRVWWK